MEDYEFEKTERVPFTTTLPEDVLEYLSQISDETGIPRNKLLEQAFYQWREEVRSGKNNGLLDVPSG